MFQNGQSSQCKAISLATHSDYTHCGIVFLDDNKKAYVMEAVQPVSIISVDNFISRGNKNHYAVYRLKDKNLLNDSLVRLMRDYGKNQMNKNYDIIFSWSEEEMYCSELVWKMYQSIALELCDTRKIKDFDLSSKLVQNTMEARYGKNIPYDETVIAPSDLMKSPKLEKVFSN